MVTVYVSYGIFRAQSLYFQRSRKRRAKTSLAGIPAVDEDGEQL